MRRAGDTSTLAVEHAFDHVVGSQRGAQRRGLRWALGINVMLLAVEVVGGTAFGSLALLADAAHLVSDVVGLAIAWGALVLAVRPAGRRHSFGFARAEVLAAQASAVMLVVAAGWIVAEATDRWRSPSPVDGAGLAAIGAVGVVANVVSAALVHRVKGRSLNVHASFLHLATDAIGSAGALIAGLLVVGWGWTRADAVASLATAGLVAWAGWALLRDATHVLMEGVPRGLDPDDVVSAVGGVAGVDGIHHLHLWNLASDVPALSAHVVVQGRPTLEEACRTAALVRSVLAERFAITNVTLELELSPVPRRDGSQPVTPQSGMVGERP